MSSPSLSEELLQYGLSEEEFDSKKKILSKKKRKSPVADDDVMWAMLQDMARSITHYEALQILYENMAFFQDSRGNDSFKWQQKSKQCSLLELKRQGKKKVKIAATSCCISCGKLNDKVLGVKKALLLLPIPNAECENTQSSIHLWCTARYAAARDEEKESEPPPPAAPSVPKTPELAEGQAGQLPPVASKKDSSSTNVNVSASPSLSINIKEYALPVAVFLMGLGLSVGSGFAGAALALSGFLGMPPLLKWFSLKMPSFHLKKAKFLIYLLGVLLALILFLISYLKPFEPAAKKYAPPPYRVVLVKEQSSSSRTRLRVHIVAPQAQTAKARAQIVMQAAQDMQRSQFPASGSGTFQYVRVVLEADEKRMMQGLALAEAEYSPDGTGKNGRNRGRAWKWNVKASHQRLNPKDPESLQKIKDSLKPYLKK